MDQFFFNYKCLNEWVGLSNRSKAKIRFQYKRYECICWHEIAINKKHYEINENQLLPYQSSPCKFVSLYNTTLKRYKTEKIFYRQSTDHNFPISFKNSNPVCDIIYGVGNSELLKISNGIAIVGSRKPTAYGRKVAYDLAKHLANHGALVISGLALGIDAIAHTAALDAGGLTLGVMASGIEAVYPKTNEALYKRMIHSNGLVISEYGENQSPQKYHFPLRNRLISGFSDTVVLVEAGEKSGTLTTAKHALEQGKTIFALPGSIYSEHSKGSNKIISEGAIPLLDFDEVLMTVGIAPNKERVRLPIQLNEVSELSKKIYNLLLSKKRISIENVASLEKCENSEIISAFTELVFEDLCEYVSLNEIQIL